MQLLARNHINATLVTACAAIWCHVAIGGVPPRSLSTTTLPVESGVSWAETRRASLKAATAGSVDDAVDIAVKSVQDEGLVAIRTLGRRALPRLFHHLLDSNTRMRALEFIALIGECDKQDQDLLRQVAAKKPDDAELQLFVDFIGLTVSDVPVTNLDERLDEFVRRWGQIKPDPFDYPDKMYYIATGFNRTRPWGMQWARKRIEEAIIKKSTDLDPARAIAVYVLSASHGKIPQEDINLLERANAVLVEQDHFSELLPLPKILTWTNGDRNADLLDPMLESLGGPDARSWPQICGDELLLPADVPLILKCAKNLEAKQPIRVGSIRLLAYGGYGDRQVEEALRDLRRDASAQIRSEAAQALLLCAPLEPPTTQRSPR